MYKCERHNLSSANLIGFVVVDNFTISSAFIQPKNKKTRKQGGG
jgi:hypothetical protein